MIQDNHKPYAPFIPHTRRQLFAFVAGEQVWRWASTSVLNAWNAFEIQAERGLPIADEFRKLPITVFDETGHPLLTHTWEEWHNLLMMDTYGPDWKVKIQLAMEQGK